MIGELNADEIETLIHKCLIGRIGCSDGKLTYIVPISFAYDGVYVYCYTQEGFKVTILRKNPTVCFEVELLESLANWQTVIAHGEFEELREAGPRLDALKKLQGRKLPIISSETTRLTEEWPFASQSLGQLPGVAFRIRLTSKTGRFEKGD